MGTVKIESVGRIKIVEIETQQFINVSEAVSLIVPGMGSAPRWFALNCDSMEYEIDFVHSDERFPGKRGRIWLTIPRGLWQLYKQLAKAPRIRMPEGAKERVFAPFPEVMKYATQSEISATKEEEEIAKTPPPGGTVCAIGDRTCQPADAPVRPVQHQSLVNSVRQSSPTPQKKRLTDEQPLDDLLRGAVVGELQTEIDNSPFLQGEEDIIIEYENGFLMETPSPSERPLETETEGSSMLPSLDDFVGTETAENVPIPPTLNPSEDSNSQGELLSTLRRDTTDENGEEVQASVDAQFSKAAAENLVHVGNYFSECLTELLNQYDGMQDALKVLFKIVSEDEGTIEYHSDCCMQDIQSSAQEVLITRFVTKMMAHVCQLPSPLKGEGLLKNKPGVDQL